MAEERLMVYGDQISDSILINGVQTIEMGVEDYYHTLDQVDWDESVIGTIAKSADMRRIGTSIRNIYAGILLVLLCWPGIIGVTFSPRIDCLPQHIEPPSS